MAIGLGKEKPKLVHINQFAIKGEPGTGFEKRGKKGEFTCRNCEYFKDNSCGQKDMIAKSTQPLKNGRRVVEPLDCCEYVDRVGKFGVDEKC
jgi:hypothetical protein